MLKQAFTVAKPEERAIKYLGSLSPLDQGDRGRIRKAAAEARFFPAKSELALNWGEPVRPSILLRGWIAHTRMLSDGRRQIVSVTLAGEPFGKTWSFENQALTDQLALTDVLLCAAPTALEGTRLRKAYRRHRLNERLQMIDQVVRLGRMDARERVCDFLLELLERQWLSGHPGTTSFDMPLTQECLADALGLTPVHLNRTLQACRRDGVLSWKGGRVTIADPSSLAQSVGRRASLRSTITPTGSNSRASSARRSSTFVKATCEKP